MKNVFILLAVLLVLILLVWRFVLRKEPEPLPDPGPEKEPEHSEPAKTEPVKTHTAGPGHSQAKHTKDQGKPSQATPPKHVDVVRAADVLAANPGGLNMRLIFTSRDVNVYNMSSELAYVAKAGTELGVVSSSRKTPAGNFILSFMGKGRVKYYVSSDPVFIKV